MWSAAINFEHDFNGFYLVAGGGGAFGEYELPPAGYDDDVWTARGHLGVGFGGWYIGGALAHTDNWNLFTPGGVETDRTVYGAGVTYNWDAWTVGFSWSEGQYNDWNGAGLDGTLDVFRLEGRYDLGPGISLDASAGYDSWDLDASEDYEAWSIQTGFRLGF